MSSQLHFSHSMRRGANKQENSDTIWSKSHEVALSEGMDGVINTVDVLRSEISKYLTDLIAKDTGNKQESTAPPSNNS